MSCKEFLDVALDALWEKLDSLVRLLKLLPSLFYMTLFLISSLGP